jgi:2,3-bisphosphoglycerate-dependent phosphoglycerate mutase
MAKRGAIYLTKEERETTQRFYDVQNPLTEEGHRQSRLTGAALRERFGVPDCVYHSGYQRTTSTTNDILDAYSPDERERIKVLQHFFLRERDTGYTYNMTADESERTFPWLQDYWQTYGAFYARPPGGESLAEVSQRVYMFLQELFRSRVGGTVFIVTHAGTMRSFRYLIEQWTHEQIDDAEASPNCAVTAYRYDEGESGHGLVLETGNSVFWQDLPQTNPF